MWTSPCLRFDWKSIALWLVVWPTKSSCFRSTVVEAVGVRVKVEPSGVMTVCDDVEDVRLKVKVELSDVITVCEGRAGGYAQGEGRAVGCNHSL